MFHQFLDISCKIAYIRITSITLRQWVPAKYTITISSIIMRVVQYTRSVTGRQTGNSAWRIEKTRHRLSVRDTSAIQRRPPDFHESLWSHYLRKRKIDILFLAFLFVLFGGHHDPSLADTPFDDPLEIGRIGHVRFSTREQGIRWRPCTQARHRAVPGFRCECSEKQWPANRLPARAENISASAKQKNSESEVTGGRQGSSLTSIVRVHTGSLFAG